MRDQSGFATFALLALLPLVLAALALVAAAALLMMGDGETRQACRVELLRQQEKIAGDLKRLLALNSSAAALRSARTAAEAAVAASAGTPAAPAARLRLQDVIARQAALAARQQALLIDARLLSRLSGPALAAERVRARLFRSAARGGGAAATPLLQLWPAAFDVAAAPADSPTPDYQPAPDFQKRQEIVVEWTFPVAAVLPTWLSGWIGAFDLNAKATCSATLVRSLAKGKDEWQAKLTRGKLSSSWF